MIHPSLKLLESAGSWLHKPTWWLFTRSDNDAVRFRTPQQDLSGCLLQGRQQQLARNLGIRSSIRDMPNLCRIHPGATWLQAQAHQRARMPESHQELLEIRSL